MGGRLKLSRLVVRHHAGDIAPPVGEMAASRMRRRGSANARRESARQMGRNQSGIAQRTREPFEMPGKIHISAAHLCLPAGRGRQTFWYGTRLSPRRWALIDVKLQSACLARAQ